MDTVRYYHQLALALYLKAREQTAAVGSLEDIFVQEAERLNRYGQAIRLRSLRARVLHEADNIREAEATADCASTKLGLGFGTGKLTLGMLLATVPDNRIIRSLGKKMLQSDQSGARPFGTVEIAIGHEGLPEGVAVVPLSRLARESNRSESDVRAERQAGGSILMTSDDFCRLLGKLEKKVLDGTLILPVTLEQLRSESDLL